jgi:hypothetical protein
MMDERREELTTADIARQPPGAAGAHRADNADLDRREPLDPEDELLVTDERADDERTATDERTVDERAADARADADERPDADERADGGWTAGERGGGVRPEAAHPGVGTATSATTARAAPASGPGPVPTTAGGDGATAQGPLLAATDGEAFRARWTDVQNGFVDSPRRAVEQADELVAELMQHLASTFAEERGRLEGQWDRGDEISTDELRTAFQRYRSFFGRLLAT